jgi:hypothetical protein
MVTPKTQSRALELAAIDLDARSRATDQEIAEAWGLADARSVRDVRASDAYAIAKAELLDYAISYAGEQVGEMVTRATEGLTRAVPDYIERLSELLTRPENAGENWRLGPQQMNAVTRAMSFLLQIADLGARQQDKPDGEQRQVTMPSLVPAQSRVETVRRYREREVTITLREVPEEDDEGDVIDMEP